MPSLFDRPQPLNWGPREDALLLLGVLQHGLGHWDKVAADDTLRPLLGDALAGAVGGAAAREEGGAAKDLPKGERRVRSWLLVARRLCA